MMAKVRAEAGPRKAAASRVSGSHPYSMGEVAGE